MLGILIYPTKTFPLPQMFSFPDIGFNLFILQPTTCNLVLSKQSVLISLYALDFTSVLVWCMEVFYQCNSPR